GSGRACVSTIESARSANKNKREKDNDQADERNQELLQVLQLRNLLLRVPEKRVQLRSAQLPVRLPQVISSTVARKKASPVWGRRLFMPRAPLPDLRVGASLTGNSGRGEDLGGPVKRARQGRATYT